MKNTNVELSLDTDLLERQIERIQCVADNLPENMRGSFATCMVDWLERDGACMAFHTQEIDNGIRIMGAIQVGELEKIIQEALSFSAKKS